MLAHPRLILDLGGWPCASLRARALCSQCIWQCGTPEAISIVVSHETRTPRSGAFQLSTSGAAPTGLEQVKSCRKNGHHPDHQPNGNGSPGNGVYNHCQHLAWSARPLEVEDVRFMTPDICK